MEDKHIEIIEDSYKNLPDKLKRILVDKGLENKVFTIGKKRGLHIDSLGILLSEVQDFILGITKPLALQGKLVKSLDVSYQIAGDLVADLNEEIFMPVRAELQQVHRVVKKDNSETKSFVTKKLNQTVQTTEKSSDHSVKKPLNYSKSDPYREPLD
jgi:hypothetical protein